MRCLGMGKSGLLGLLLCVMGCGAGGAGPDPAVTKRLGLPELPSRVGLIESNASLEYATSESGLKYRILRQGTGAKPTASQQVKVQYHGWLDNQKVFDSSYGRGAISFGLNQVIPGWTEGMQLVGEGGMIELQIPGNLGYGENGAPPDIPPNATLHFIVELLEVR